MSEFIKVNGYFVESKLDYVHTTGDPVFEDYPNVRYKFHYNAGRDWSSCVYYDEDLNLVGEHFVFDYGDGWRFIPVEKMSRERIERIREFEKHIDMTKPEREPCPRCGDNSNYPHVVLPWNIYGENFRFCMDCAEIFKKEFEERNRVR